MTQGEKLMALYSNPRSNWLKGTTLRKERMMLFDEQAQNFIELRNITRKDKTTMEPYERSGAAAGSKTPDPDFEDVQEKGAAYYGQFEAFYYTTQLVRTARALFTKLVIVLDKYHGVGDAPVEEQAKTLLGESCLMIGALCDAFDFDLEDIVKNVLGL